MRLRRPCGSAVPLPTVFAAALALAMLLTLVAPAKGHAAPTKGPRHQFTVEAGDYQLVAIPDEWRVDIKATFTGTATETNATGLVVIPPPLWLPAHTSFTLETITPTATVTDMEVDGHPAWQVELEQPATQGDVVTVAIEGYLTTRDGYPKRRTFAGITPEGIYELDWVFRFGQNTGYFPEYEVSSDWELPSGWSLVPSPRPAYFWSWAGPYHRLERTIAGVALDIYAFGPDSANDIEGWAQDVFSTLTPLVGPNGGTEMIVVELPKYHGGGALHGVVSFTTQLTPEMAPMISLPHLPYHEFAHTWRLLGEVESWPYAFESLTEYLVVMIMEEHLGVEEALDHLNEKKDYYLSVATSETELALAEADGQTQSQQVRAIRYNKATWFWHELRFLLGDEALSSLLKDLRDFTDENRGQTLSLDNLKSIIAHQADLDLSQYIEAWLTRTGTAQFAVTEVSSEPAQDGTGDYLTDLKLCSIGSVTPPRIEVLLTGQSESVTRQLPLEAGCNWLRFNTAFKVTEVTVDPNDWILKTPASREAIEAVATDNLAPQVLVLGDNNQLVPASSTRAIGDGTMTLILIGSFLALAVVAAALVLLRKRSVKNTPK